MYKSPTQTLRKLASAAGSHRHGGGSRGQGAQRGASEAAILFAGLSGDSRGETQLAQTSLPVSKGRGRERNWHPRRSRLRHQERRGGSWWPRIWGFVSGSEGGNAEEVRMLHKHRHGIAEGGGAKKIDSAAL